VAGWGGFHSGAGFTPYAVPVPVVPGVTGQQASTASAALTAAGLTSSQTPVTSCPPSSFGQVISQNPASGTQAVFGQAVTLTVCAAKVSVPDVTGLDDASARSAITSAGLRVGTVTLTPNCTIAKGTVLSQNPAGGTQVTFGSSVSLNEATRSGSTAQATPHFCTK
jgi:serine/threonine-protein kinase